jgi:Mg-chelatase subunit ChlD
MHKGFVALALIGACSQYKSNVDTRYDALDAKMVPVSMEKAPPPAAQPVFQRALSAPAFAMRPASKLAPASMAGSGGGAMAPRDSMPPRSPGVQAGSSDDNLQFNAFLRFLDKNARLALPEDVSDRVVLEVRDAQGLPIFGANVAAGHMHRRTYTDGRTLIYPRGAPIEVEFGGVKQTLKADGPRVRTVKLDAHRSETQGRVPLDIAFVLDTTGSMGDEIEQLRRTLAVIHFQLTHLDPAADVRFGLVEYKDRGDDFVTRPIPFTSDVEEFRAALANLKAYGGGDEPEDVQAGLEQALHALQWRDANAVKIAFLIGDAPPHLDYGEQYTYLNAAQEAARRGIKIAAVGCSGLNLQGEVVWREIAQATMAPFVFLTRGERGDMDGSASTVSHHVGSNWVAENLETIVVRMVKGELAPLQPRLVAGNDDYFEARKGAKLPELFRQSVQQLVDYAVEPIGVHAPMQVKALSVKSPSLGAAAAKLEKELRAAVNAQTPAPLALEGQLARDDAGRPELLVKLMRVSTGEMLSLSLIKLDASLVE